MSHIPPSGKHVLIPLEVKEEFWIERHTGSWAETHNHQASLIGDWLTQERDIANGGSLV